MFRYNIIVYTGYNIDRVYKNNINGFKFIKCGNYDSNLKQTPHKTDDYIQFASTNQKLYDKKLNLVSENGKYYFKRRKIIYV